MSEKHFITPTKFNFSNCRKIMQEDTFRLKDSNNNVIRVTLLFVLNIIKYTGLCFLYEVRELACVYLACMYSSLQQTFTFSCSFTAEMWYRYNISHYTKVMRVKSWNWLFPKDIHLVSMFILHLFIKDTWLISLKQKSLS